MFRLKQLVKRTLNQRTVARCRTIADAVNAQIGLMLLPFMRDRIDRIEQAHFTLSDSNRNLLDIWLRAALARRALASSREADVAEYHRNYWRGQGANHYHANHKDYSSQTFQEDFECVVDAVKKIRERRQDFGTVCEIGTGAGQVLSYLSTQLPRLERLVGIDLCESTIEENKRQLYSERLQWVAADASEWIEHNAAPAWIFLTYRGVLEYFTQQQVLSLFHHIAHQCSPAVFVAIEPVACDFDLGSDLDSRTYGAEYSFSHNYPHLFRNAGFEVTQLTSKDYYSYQLCAFLATVGLE